jgi:puromycin-sensitive aminopeptidase
MMEQYLGEDVFRSGVSLYLQRHSFANTDNEDLWRALEEVSGEPVGEIMDTWIFQGGYPILDVTATDDGFTLSQRPFRLIGEGEGTWEVPVIYQSDDGEGRIVVGPDEVSVRAGDNLIVDSGGDGFYRVAYDHRLFESVVERLSTLDAVERHSVVSDALAEMLAGTASAADYLQLVEQLSGEEDKEIWSLALAGIDELDRVISSDDRPVLQAFVRGLTSGTAEDLGWVAAPGESDRTRALRGLLLRARGTLGQDPETISLARSLITSGAESEAEVADAALSIVAAHGDLHDFDRFIAMSEGATTPQLTVKYLRAASQVPHPEVPGRILDMVFDRRIRSQDAFWVLAVLIGQKTTGAAAWKMITDRWDEVMAVLPPAHRYRILDHLKYRSEPDIVESLPAWFAAHPIAGSEKAISQRIEMVNVRAGLRERESERIGDAIRSARSDGLP